jgi:hypothetical protein
MTDGSRAILILGMHRSGTSALTRVVNLLGAELGSRLMPAAARNNENGFWENQDAVDINECLLADLGRNWHDVREMPAGWMDSEAALRARASIRQLYASEFVDKALWALKDPRLCRLAPLWLDVLGELGVAVSIVFVLRSPDEVAASLQARDGWARGLSRLLWLQHMREAELASRDYPRCVVNFDELIEGWEAVTTRIARELTLAWPVDPASVAQRIAEFVDPGARHHAFVPPRESAAEWPELFHAAFERTRTHTSAWAELAQLGADYVRAAATFGPCVSELTANVRSMDELRHYFETLHMTESAQLEQARHSLSVQDGLGSVNAAVGELAARAAQRDAEIRDLLAGFGESLRVQQQAMDAFGETVQARLATADTASAQVHAVVETLARLQGERSQREAERDASIARELEGAAKQLDVQVLGDAVVALAQQLDALNQRMARRRWWTVG